MERRLIEGLITWRISARAEISIQLTGLKVCCDYITNFSPGWNISLGTKYEVSGQSKWHRARTRIVKIGALLLAQFFGMVTANKMTELKRNLSLAASLSARKTYLQRKRRHLQARRVHGFPDSLVLFSLIFIEVDVLTLSLRHNEYDSLFYCLNSTEISSAS